MLLKTFVFLASLASEILVLKIEMLICFKIRRISNYWVLSDPFWISLRFLRYSFWNNNLLDTHLGLLDTDITSKSFVCLRDVLKTSSRYVFKICLQDVFKTCLQDIFKTSWRPTNVCWATSRFGRSLLGTSWYVF